MMNSRIHTSLARKTFGFESTDLSTINYCTPKPNTKYPFKFSSNQFYVSAISKDMEMLHVLKAGGVDHLLCKRYAQASIYFQDVLSNFQQCLGSIESPIEMQKAIRELKLSSHKNLSLCYLKLNQFQKCVEQCKTILEIEPNCLKIIYRIGRAYISLQMYDQAKFYLTNGFHLDPSEKQIMKALEEIETISFSKKQAKQHKNTPLLRQLLNLLITIIFFALNKAIAPLRWIGIVKAKPHKL